MERADDPIRWGSGGAWCAAIRAGKPAFLRLFGMGLYIPSHQTGFYYEFSTLFQDLRTAIAPKTGSSMKYATLALLSLCAFLSGCDWGHHREAEGHADRHAEVFVTKAPTREYTEIGHYRRKSGDPEEVIAWTRDQARIDDADGAIVDMNAGTRSNGSGNTAAVTTIRWKEAP